MKKSSKAALTIVIVIALITAGYYFMFRRGEEEVEVERAPDFKFYDSVDFMSSETPIELQLSEFRDSIVIMVFNNIFDPNATVQDNVSAHIHASYPAVILINIDQHGPGNSPALINEYKVKNNYTWNFTFDDNTITNLYDVIKIPTVIIVDRDGFGTYKAERGVDYDELRTNLDPVISNDAKRINVGKLPGKKAPAFQLTDTDDRPLNSTDYRGKVILLDFMSLTCTSCKLAEKTLKQIHEQYKDDNFAMVSIDIDPSDSKEKIKEHWEQEGLKWRVCRDPGDMTLKYHVEEIVYIVIIDIRGYITYQSPKSTVPDRNELEDAIDEALTGKGSIIQLEHLSYYAMAVLLGIGTFFSPCSFPMLPGYMSYYLQKDMAIQIQSETRSADSAAGKPDSRKRVIRRAFASGVVSALGIVLVFTIIGALALFAGNAVKPYITSLGPIVGVILLILGALMLTNLQYNRLIRPFQGLYEYISSSRKKGGKDVEERDAVEGGAVPAGKEPQKGHYAGLFTYGVGYGAAASACTAPLFIAIVTQALLQLELLEGALVLTFYILSMVVLMIAVTVAIAWVGRSAVQKLAAYTGHIKKLSGIILIAVGIYLIIFYYLSL